MHKNIQPIQNDNVSYKNLSSAKLLTELNKLHSTFDNLKENLKKPILLEGNYEVSQLTSGANFSNYMLYFLCAIFVVVSLTFIYKNPEIGNLDIFMVVLAVGVLIYYIYDYYMMKQRKGPVTK